jgi:hypothetical protein
MILNLVKACLYLLWEKDVYNKRTFGAENFYNLEHSKDMFTI